MHHASPIEQLAGLLLGSWFAFVFVTGLLLVYAMPLMALVVTLNIRKIRKELEQLNETMSLPSRHV